MCALWVSPLNNEALSNRKLISCTVPTIVPALQSAIAMDEIAPEYDVVVLGTGRTRPRMEGQSRESHDMRGFKLIHNAQV